MAGRRGGATLMGCGASVFHLCPSVAKLFPPLRLLEELEELLQDGRQFAAFSVDDAKASSTPHLSSPQLLSKLRWQGVIE